MGLSPGFGFAEFIESRDHNLYQQINNGMTRALCGNRDATEAHTDLFWNLDADPVVLDGALGLLERIEFGLTEEMELTQARLRARWGLPFRLPPMRLNSTGPGGAESDPQNISRIVARNTVDIALYEVAAMRFRERRTPTATAQRSDTVFSPAAGAKVGLGNIPGRTGFHPFEEIGFAWIDDVGPACMRLHPPVTQWRVAFEIYTIVPKYPAEDIVVRLDGRQIALSVTQGEPCWFTLTSDLLPLPAGQRPIELSIELPYAVPARFLHPGTPDPRNLGVAVAAVALQEG
jgi:hypothetical protein